MSQFHIYYLYDDDDNIVYVGMSKNVAGRFSQHLKEKTGIKRYETIESFDDSSDCAMAELEHIVKLKPKLNVLEVDRYARQAEGIARAKSLGVYRGRTPSLTPEQVAEAQKDIDAGIPKSQVARTLGVSRQTLYSSLQREGYR
jgi:hypothetical protein